jgi:beta-N-acetylhexosaminidase
MVDTPEWPVAARGDGECHHLPPRRRQSQFGVAGAALRAGADVALWVTTDEVPAVLERLTSAVNSGELDMAKVDLSVLRVSSFKGKSPRCGG